MVFILTVLYFLSATDKELKVEEIRAPSMAVCADAAQSAAVFARETGLRVISIQCAPEEALTFTYYTPPGS